MKVQMGAVGFVHNNGEVVLLGNLHALHILCGDALIGRIDQNQIAAVWIAVDVALQYLWADTCGQAGGFVQFQRQIDWLCVRQQ